MTSTKGIHPFHSVEKIHRGRLDLVVVGKRRYEQLRGELAENATFREQYSDEDLLAVEDDYLQAESAGDSLTPNLTRSSSPRG
jgi:hypothetical protein